MSIEAFPERLVLASRNAKKLREIQQQLQSMGIELLAVSEFESAPTVEETGATFVENADLKAVQTAQAIGQWCIADDSGLLVDQLRGAPGVHSARYAGENASDAENNAKLLTALQGVELDRRGARFVCCLSVSDAAGEVRLRAKGECRGRILEELHGGGGFGYDPLFLIPEWGRTFGQLSPAVKGVISHRARAFDQLKRTLRG